MGPHFTFSGKAQPLIEAERSNMGRTRTHEIHLRLDDKEYKTLKRNSAKCNLTQQSYIRKIIKNVVPRESPSADFWTLYRELQHTTKELREIGWVAKKSGTIDWSTYWELNKRIKRELHKILSAVIFPDWVVQEIDEEGRCIKFRYK